MSDQLRVTFIPGKPAKGRIKAKSWRLVVGSGLIGALEIKPGWGAETDPYPAWSLVQVMVDDYNALHGCDRQVEEYADALRESFPKWQAQREDRA